MNCNTGHLVTREMIVAMDARGRDEYEPLPETLHRAAKMKLAGRQEAHVSLTSGGKLSKFAAGNRKQRRRMAAQSRKRNRG